MCSSTEWYVYICLCVCLVVDTLTVGVCVELISGCPLTPHHRFIFPASPENVALLPVPFSSLTYQPAIISFDWTIRARWTGRPDCVMLQILKESIFIFIFRECSFYFSWRAMVVHFLDVEWWQLWHTVIKQWEGKQEIWLFVWNTTMFLKEVSGVV